MPLNENTLCLLDCFLDCLSEEINFFRPFECRG